MVEDKKIEADVNVLMVFYETLLVCITNKICDGPTAEKFFQKDAKWFFIWHSSYIRKRQSGSKFESSDIDWLSVKPLRETSTEA